MKREILYKYAEDNNGNIIHIDRARSGTNYFCPSCKDKFKFKSGKIRQHHFAHNNPSPNCTTEGYLHKTFKKYLLNLIKERININLPIEIKWICNICNKEHNANLLNGIIDAKEEYSMGICRPDITLFSEIKNTPIIIEIVVTHEPENNVIEHCKKNNIVLIRIKLDTIDDLENIENKIRTQSNIIFFTPMMCPNYQVFIDYQRSLNPSMNISGRIRPRKPTIDEIVADQENRKRKQQFAIKNYYRNKR